MVTDAEHCNDDMSVNCSLAARYGLGTNEHVEKFKREYAEKLNREEYAKELKQMRSVSSLHLLSL